MSSDNNITSTEATASNLPAAPTPMDSTWTSLIPMLLIFGVFYFLLIKPQEKKRKEQLELISSVKKGEEVVTNAGIHGKVVKVNESESTISLEIAENTVIKLEKSAILEITSRKTTPEKKADAAPKAKK